MSSNDVYLKILPGKKLNTSEDLDEGIFIDAILCDFRNCTQAVDYDLIPDSWKQGATP